MFGNDLDNLEQKNNSELDNQDLNPEIPEMVHGYNQARQPRFNQQSGFAPQNPESIPRTQQNTHFKPDGLSGFLENEISRFLVQAMQDTEAFANHHLYNPQSRHFYRLFYYTMVFLQECLRYLSEQVPELSQSEYYADNNWTEVLNNPPQNQGNRPVLIR